MTPLFIRFYFGIIAVLIVAWLIQAYVFRGTTEAENVSVVEDALSGGAYSARDDIIEGDAGDDDDSGESVANESAEIRVDRDTRADFAVESDLEGAS